MTFYEWFSIQMHGNVSRRDFVDVTRFAEAHKNDAAERTLNEWDDMFERWRADR